MKSLLKIFLKEYSEKIAGGKGDGRDPSDFDQKELLAGIKVELEHTDDIAIALEITMDHLTEDPKYYTNLAKIHQEKQ
jgi:hypothetical protein